MKITIIGSGTCVPSLKRASPCIMVTTEKAKILLDTGPGTIRQLLKADVQINDIDYIIYSHFHTDHTADMVPFIFASKYSPGCFRTKDLSIIGPSGLKSFYQYFVKAYGKWVIPEHFSIHWTEGGKEPITFDPFIIKTAPTKHTENSIAIRIEDRNGTTIAYSGDSDYCPELIQLARNVDLLILECSFPEQIKCEGHLVPSLAGKIASQSRCKRLVLTHFYPPCDGQDLLTPLRREFSGDAILAEDMMEFYV